jgi:hypothetical protein
MKTKVFESTYKDQKAISMESKEVAAQFLPSVGSKMASLIYRPLGLELLVQRPGKQYLLQPYDGNYVQGECSGFDEMFPSIDECYYEAFPWKGTKISDHGELWAIPWDLDVEGEKLHFSTHGVRFPYRFEKWAYFTSNDILRIDYKVTNLSSFDMDFMWAAHTMFNLEEGARLVLPEGVGKIVSTMSYSGRLGRYGDEHRWPTFKSKDNTTHDLSQIRSKSVKDAEKYFIKGRMPEGWCALKYVQSNLTLALSFPKDRVPYLGILTNEGGWEDLYNIFLEPCTASFDRLDVARLHNEYSTLKAKSSYEWHLNITIAEGIDFKSIVESGEIVF